MQKNRGINFLGRVLDQEKQAPISGVKVLLNFPGAPPVVYTDLEGIYRFPVKFDSSSSFKGELTIEAKGYKTYNSFIELLPNKKDLGDIQLLRPDSKTSEIQLLRPDSKTSEIQLIPPDSKTSEIQRLPPDSKTSEIQRLPPDSKTSEIQHLPPDSKTRVLTSTKTESSSMLLPIIVAVMTGLAILIAVAIKPLPQAEPQEIPKKIRTYHIKKPHKSFKTSSLVKNNCRVGTAHLPKQLVDSTHPTSV